MQNVKEIATVALLGALTADEIETVIQCMDLGRLRAQMVALGMCEPQATDVQVAKLYFSRRCSAVSPNAFFDETWYVLHYGDVGAAVSTGYLVSGFVHFIQRGMYENRWPNALLAAEAADCLSPGPELASIDSQAYLAINPSVATFIGAFPHLTPLKHYNLFGRLLGYVVDRRRHEREGKDNLSLLRSAFDPDFYRSRYLGGEKHDDPFAHYLIEGTKLGHSPNRWFDESWYRAFYPEVETACDEGWLLSGFFHYLVAGRNEGRQPRFQLTHALEARMPGVTQPALLHRVAELDRRLDPKLGLPQFDAGASDAAAIWIVFPTLNPDIMFGGYRALLWLIAALVDCGFVVNAVCLQEQPNLRYFLLREDSARIREVFQQVRVFGPAEFSGTTYGPTDRFLAYSAWDLPVCARLAKATSHPLPMLLVQEFEPVFYENGSHRALCESIYRMPHFAIINSEMLRDYLVSHRLSVFADPTELERKSRHVVFQHRVIQLPRQTASAMSARSRRLLVLYARPEAHAARNTFEIAVLALQRLCQSGFFGPEWRFEGVGALSKLPPMSLGGGHEIVFQEKQSESQYARMCAAMDVGVSLMYAPHPSVMPFEFATTGALVVTNTFENRDAARLVSICANLVPCDLSIDGVTEGIRDAVKRVDDFEARAKNALVPDATCWEEIFTRDFVTAVFGESRVRAVATVAAFPRRSRRAKLVQGADETNRVVVA